MLEYTESLNNILKQLDLNLEIVSVSVRQYSQRTSISKVPGYIVFMFVNYNVADEKVRHDELEKLLEENNLESRDNKIISNLYYGLNEDSADRLECN